MLPSDSDLRYLDIGLPFYGNVDYLKSTVESIINQTDPNWRLTVVDDGYPDPSVQTWFSQLNNSKIRYIRNESNLGANGNYRKCLGYLESDYCLIMGADDILLPNYVGSILHGISSNPNSDVYHPTVQVIDEDGKVVFPLLDKIKAGIRSKLGSNVTVFGSTLAESLMLGNWMYFPAITWRTETIKAIGFRDGLNVCQDLALAVDVIKQNGSFTLLSEINFQYRRHLHSDSSLRALRGDRFIEEQEFFSGLVGEFSELGWRKASLFAKLRITSRLHAIVLMPKAFANGFPIRKLARHAFGS